MSANGNGWKPRKILTLELPSGKEVMVRRPGPEIVIKTGRIIRGFARNAGLTDQHARESMTKDIADMSDEELAMAMQVGRETVVAMLVSPKLVLNPRPDSDEIGPDDLELEDFWFLSRYAMENFVGIKIPAGETEVEVADLETFREESSVPGDSMGGQDIRAEAQQPIADQGPVNSP